jgi:ribosomal protein S21
VQVLVRDNNVDQALKALKKKMQREGIFREMKLRRHFEKPSERRAPGPQNGAQATGARRLLGFRRSDFDTSFKKPALIRRVFSWRAAAHINVTFRNLCRINDL